MPYRGTMPMFNTQQEDAVFSSLVVLDQYICGHKKRMTNRKLLVLLQLPRLPLQAVCLVVIVLCLERCDASMDGIKGNSGLAGILRVKRGGGIADEITEDEQAEAEAAAIATSVTSGSPSVLEAVAEQNEEEKYIAEFNVTTTEYEFIIELTNQYYCERFGELHVLCALQSNKTGMKYYDRGVNDTEIEFIRRFVVRVRKRVIMGKETNGDPGPLPRALRLHVLHWNQELQVIAQRLANQCRNTLNKSLIYATDSFSNLRVNIALSRDTSDRPRWTHALMYWYKEVHQVKPDVIYRPDTGIDNYAAMVWAATGIMGCGYAACYGMKPGIRVKVYVCVFAPGTVPGIKIYPTELSELPTTINPKNSSENIVVPVEPISKLGGSVSPVPESIATPTPCPMAAIPSTPMVTVPSTPMPPRQNPFKKVIFKEEFALG